MTDSEQLTAGATVPSGPAPALREWLGHVADVLIPASDPMPSATEVDVTGKKLDVVLSVRPDLAPALDRAWVIARDVEPGEVLQTLQAADATCLDAVRLAVGGGYYLDTRVRTLLGYSGQEPRVVRVDVIPEYVEEGLLDRVMERGPIFRDDE